jgi:hypothetical protein
MTVVVSSVDAAGNTNSETLSENLVTVDTTAPDLPSITREEASTIGTVLDGTADLNGYTITGTADALSHVKIYDNIDNAESKLIAEGDADEYGNFSIEMGSNDQLIERAGQHTLTATATDAAGNESSISTSNISFSLNTVELAVGREVIDHGVTAETELLVKQGQWEGNPDIGSVDVITNTSDKGGSLTYTLVGDESGSPYTGLDFVIYNNGVVGFTDAGAASLAANPEKIGLHTLFIKVEDGHGGSDIESVTVNVQSAVDLDSGTASLPGSISDWEIKPTYMQDSEGLDAYGFIFTHHRDGMEDISVAIPAGINSVSFTGSGSSVVSTINIANDGTISSLSIDSVEQAGGRQTILIAPDAYENTLISLPSSLGIDVTGAQNSLANAITEDIKDLADTVIYEYNADLDQTTISGLDASGRAISVENGGGIVGSAIVDADGNFRVTLKGDFGSGDLNVISSPVLENVREDIVTVNASADDAHFQWGPDNTFVRMWIGNDKDSPYTILRGVETVTFTAGNETVSLRIVGAGAYASVEDANTAHGGLGDAGRVVFPEPSISDDSTFTGYVVEDRAGAEGELLSGDISADVFATQANGTKNKVDHFAIELGKSNQLAHEDEYISMVDSGYGTLTLGRVGP